MSRLLIQRFIRLHHIDPGEFTDSVDSFPSFNAFFTRSLRRDMSRLTATAHSGVYSPADGCVLIRTGIRNGESFQVKRSRIDVAGLVGERGVEFLGCPETVDVVIVRLAPQDYHRFHFPCSGAIKAFWSLPGGYRPVHPFALSAFSRVHTVNHRHVTCLNGMGLNFIQAEVGAFGVGTIVQTCQESTFSGLEEKGMFRVGGSTVVLVFPGGLVRFPEDLRRYSDDGIETRIRVGDRLGERLDSAI